MIFEEGEMLNAYWVLARTPEHMLENRETTPSMQSVSVDHCGATVTHATVCAPLVEQLDCIPEPNQNCIINYTYLIAKPANTGVVMHDNICVSLNPGHECQIGGEHRLAHVHHLLGLDIGGEHKPQLTTQRLNCKSSVGLISR